MMDRLDEWRLFESVASLSSFSRAARVRGRSPQAVTRAIAALEARIGTKLLHRTTRSVSLTGEGARYLERSRRALAAFEALESPADATAPLTGTLAVTAPVLFGRLHVVPVIARFLERHPELDVRLLLLDRVVSLAEEGIDVGVRLGPLPDSSLRLRTLGHVRSVICASPAYLARAGRPRSPDALSRHACISFSGTSPIPNRWSFRGTTKRERSIRVRARLTVNTAEAAIEAAVAGLGIVRVLSYQVDRLVAEGALRVVLARFEPDSIPVQLVQLPGVQTRAASAFADHAAGLLRTLLSPSSSRIAAAAHKRG
jgi:DNA-binding transcriptional LysR family regulator